MSTISLREQPMYRDMISGMIDPEVVLRYVARVMGVDRGELMKRERGGIVRGVAAEMLYKYSGLTQVQIGELLGGVDYGAVYLLRRRLREKMVENEAVSEKYKETEVKLRNSV